MAFTRRQAISGAAVLAGAALAACSQRTVLADPAEPVPPIGERLDELERRHDAVIGVYAVDLGSGRTVEHRTQESFAMCSTFKGYLAGLVLRMVGHGERSLEQRLYIDPAAIVANSPRTGPRAGADMAIGDLCQAILQVSDNTAANILLHDAGGPAAVTNFARSIGDPRSRLDRFETELNSAVPGDPRDTSTPQALGNGYRTLLTGDALAGAQRQTLEDWMRANETSSMRPGLPPGWTTADKTGSGDYGTTNDVGIAYGPQGQRVLLAVLTHSARDDADAQGNRPLIGEVASAVLPALLTP
ncbi:class A beta-lactamase [Mycobacterium sp. WMMD1722]|uniref:class A beta-lactamase n=1 Tax=Mycobacterium sp. WMMD1722 TaxID=3404117 RepID=UPI003BF54D49